MDRLLRPGTIVLLAALLCACARDSEKPASVTELLVTADTGHLLARRRAIRELASASPATPAEMERLLEAARSTGRQRLRRAALSALANPKRLRVGRGAQAGPRLPGRSRLRRAHPGHAGLPRDLVPPEALRAQEPFPGLNSAPNMPQSRMPTLSRPSRISSQHQCEADTPASTYTSAHRCLKRHGVKKAGRKSLCAHHREMASRRAKPR